MACFRFQSSYKIRVYVIFSRPLCFSELFAVVKIIIFDFYDLNSSNGFQVKPMFRRDPSFFYFILQG